MNYLLGLDVGSSSVKAALLDCAAKAAALRNDVSVRLIIVQHAVTVSVNRIEAFHGAARSQPLLQRHHAVAISVHVAE